MTDFHFLRPWWFLALIPALLILIVWLRNSVRDSTWEAVFDRQLLERLWLERPGAVSRVPLWLTGFGWCLAVVALAGPTWQRQPQPVWRAEDARVIVLDLSASMNAADLAPSRLERARFKIMDILAHSREGRTALVVFAGEPHIVTPLTEDVDTITNLLSAVSTDIVPAEGDSGADALRTAGELLSRDGVAHGDVLLITDGLADTAAALTAARKLRAQGRRLSVLGVGTAAGAPIPAPDGGFSGMARFDPEPLRRLAATGGGQYSSITAGDEDITRVLSRPNPGSTFRKAAGGGVQRWIEQGVWLLPVLLLIGASGFRRGWLAIMVAIAVLPPPAHAFEWRDLWLRSDQQAAEALRNGQAAEAAHQFTDPAWRGMALYRSGDYAGAAQAFAGSQGIDADYNRGNALARAGRLEEAANAYRSVLTQAPDHADAKANLALVERVMQQNQNQNRDQDQNKNRNQNQNRNQNRNQDQDQQAKNERRQSPSLSQQEQSRARNQQRSEGGEADGSSSTERQKERRTESGIEQQKASAERTRPDKSGDDFAGGLSKPAGDDAQKRQASEAGDNVRDKPSGEAAIALDQWLRQIPEDPSGLLRRKFMLDHLRREQEGK